MSILTPHQLQNVRRFQEGGAANQIMSSNEYQDALRRYNDSQGQDQDSLAILQGFQGQMQDLRDGSGAAQQPQNQYGNNFTLFDRPQHTLSKS
mgnify:FL=1